MITSFQQLSTRQILLLTVARYLLEPRVEFPEEEISSALKKQGAGWMWCCPSARPLACPDLHPQNEPRPWPARMGVSGAPLPLPSLLPGSSPLPAWCGCCKSSGGASRFPLRARCAPACCSRDLGCWLPLQVSSRPAAGSRRAVCARPSAAAQATRAGGLQRQIRSCAQARISVNGAKSRHCRAAFPSEAPGVGPCLLQLLVGGWWLSDQLPPWSRGFAPSLRQISFLL